MGLVAELASWFWAVLTGFVRWFVGQLLHNPPFAEGFVWGFGLALAIGWFSRRVLFLRAQVLHYFNPTHAPATEPGPSPSQIATGCRSAVVQLAVLIGFGLLLLFVVVQAFRAGM